jgi:hypothetical protein
MGDEGEANGSRSVGDATCRWHEVPSSMNRLLSGSGSTTTLFRRTVNALNHSLEAARSKKKIPRPTLLTRILTNQKYGSFQGKTGTAMSEAQLRIGMNADDDIRACRE